jgi:hypothetical protein
MMAKPFKSACLSAVLGLLTVLGTAGCDQSSNAAAPQAVPSPEGGGDVVCGSRRDCTYDIVPLVESEADCACPKCPVDAPAIPRAAYQERAKAFSKICGNWAQTNACPPTFCETPPKLACVTGQCSLEGQQGVEP